MKRLMKSKRILAAFMALAIVFSYSLVSLADGVGSLTGGPTITLTEQNGQPVFQLNRDTNLFDGFTSVMPGDKLSQDITLRGKNMMSSYRIYMYARVCENAGTPEHPGDTVLRKAGFLDYLTLEVSRNGSSIDVMNAGTGADGVYLGTFSAGSEATLTVDLTVDINMGNEFQNAQEYIDWVFYAQQVVNPITPDPDPEDPDDPGEDIEDDPVPEGPGPDDPDDPGDPGEDIEDDPVPEGPGPDLPGEEDIDEDGVPTTDMPNTGDDTPIALWAALAVLSGGGMAALLVSGKKEKQNV